MITERINIDVRPGGIPIVIHVTQYEVGLRKFVFTPYTSNGTQTVVAGSATLEGTKPDGYAFQQACEMVDGVITYTLQEQLCAVEGRVWSRLVIRDTDGGMIGYTAIVWVVGRAGVADDAVMSDSDISALRQFLDEFGGIDAYRGALNGALAAVGGPLVAATASAMTDTTKVYVYTGSESGYTEGHWYYWNGSAWTDGGVYQSTGINTDKTLTVEDMAADAKATGDAVAELKNDLDVLELVKYDSSSDSYVNEGKSMYPDTSWGTSSNYAILAFIPVRKGDIVYYTGNTGASTGVAIVNGYTDASEASYYNTFASGDSTIYTDRAFPITDSKIKYVACCFRTSNGDPYEIKVVHSPSLIMDSIEDIQNDIYQAQKPQSFFNMAGYYNSSGTFTASSTIYSAVFEVSKYDFIDLSVTTLNYTNVYTLLDKDLNVIASLYNGTSSSKAYNINVDVREGAWLYITLNASLASTLNITAYAVEKDIQYYQHMNGTPEMGFYHDSSWNATSSAPSLAYDVEEGQTVIIKGNADAWFNLYTFVDANNTVLTYKQSLSGNTTLHVVAPANAVKLYVATSVSNSSTLIVYQVKHFGNEATTWTGKKIVWFGTSIPAGGYIGDSKSNSYPKFIGDMLGADVYNEAVGSSNVHCKQPTRVDADTNPYGFIGNFESCSRCLTNSTEEMQWIIDHYNSSIWTSETVSSMPDVLKNQILSNSYQTKLDKWLTAETFPDLFVFDHGHNDPFNSLSVENEYYSTYGDYSLYSFRGAMNFLIQRILNFNPYAKIVMIGEYTGKSTDQIPTMQMQVSNDWEIPICKDWEKLGWTKTKQIVVHGSWVESDRVYTWTPSETSSYMTPFARWIPDGVHPHTDASHKALQHMANVIGQWLNNDIGFTD